jgi:hypothetical protein
MSMKVYSIWIRLVWIGLLGIMMGAEMPGVTENDPWTKTYDFENNDLKDLRTFKLRFDYSGYITDEIARNGKYSMRFELRKDDDLNWEQGSRAELKDNLNAPLNQELWYGFSLYIPESFPELERNCIVAQWHGEHDKGEYSRSPVLAIRIEGNRLYINSRSSKQKIQTANDGLETTHYSLSDFPKNKWLDFVVKASWSYQNDGLLAVWLNGDQIITYNGPLGYHDDQGPYFKFGIYKHSGDIPLKVFVDEYRRGISQEEVDPGLFGTDSSSMIVK